MENQPLKQRLKQKRHIILKTYNTCSHLLDFLFYKTISCKIYLISAKQIIRRRHENDSVVIPLHKMFRIAEKRVGIIIKK